MPWDHHPTFNDLRYEHGFTEWSDRKIIIAYQDFVRSDGTFDWLALHQWDHDREPAPHLSDAARRS